MRLLDIPKLVKNFTKELHIYIKNGRPKTTSSEYEERLNICESCEFFRKQTCSCGACGCYLGTKAQWATSECPKNKWPKIEEK